MTVDQELAQALDRLDATLAAMNADPLPTDVDLAVLATPALRERVGAGELTWAQIWAEPWTVPGGADLVRAALRHRSRGADS